MAPPNYSFRVLWSAEDDAYVATSPEFAGVSGIGDDPEAALTEARAALRLAIKSYQSSRWALPDPESVGEYSGQFRLRLPRGLHARLAQRASDEGVSLNAYVSSLLAEAVGGAVPQGILPKERR
ncbi:MAG: toxin-antitoxin system HicB family antitoxin [Gemmatimonadaceae bacterium]